MSSSVGVMKFPIYEKKHSCPKPPTRKLTYPYFYPYHCPSSMSYEPIESSYNVGPFFLELLWSPAVTIRKNPWHPGIPAIQPNDLLHLSWHILDVNKKWRLVMERRPVIQYSDISYNSCHKLWPWQSVITGDFYRIKNINHKCGCKYL